MEYGILVASFMLVWFMVGLLTATLIYETSKLDAMN
jgi:hypothetical protein